MIARPCPVPQLRDATEADLPELIRLFESSGIDQPGDNRTDRVTRAWRQLAGHPGARVRVAELDGRPVGTLTLFIQPLLAHDGTPAAVVEDVAVCPAHQGQGLGRALMEDAMRLAADAGCYKLALSSSRKRTPAHRFYENLGFALHGFSFVADLPAPETPR